MSGKDHIFKCITINRKRFFKQNRSILSVTKQITFLRVQGTISIRKLPTTKNKS